MIRPKCKICGNPSATNGLVNGMRRYKSICSNCRYQIERTGYAYGQHKKSSCEYCGFIPIHSCQLAVDHIDGNRKNNSISNLQTLCSNCHLLKTHLDRMK